jgi:hypothetical protein
LVGASLVNIKIEGLGDTFENFASYSDQLIETNVRLFFVDVTKIEESLEKLKQQFLINVNYVYTIG